MNKNEFLKRFQLSALTKSDTQQKLLNKPNSLIESAVLVALTEKNNQLNILFTKRAQHLKHHGGQISFPGGKVEPSDLSLTATALREAQEEINLHPNNVEVIGQLHPYQTITGFRITPIVAILKPDSAMTMDKNEVEEIFFVPIQHFFNENNNYSIDMQHKTGNHKVHFMPYKQHNIWGATAAIINDLSKHLV